MIKRCVEMALGCVERAYPVQIALSMERDGDARPVRELTPAFYGCYDWHSAVHAHWTVARGIGCGVGEELARAARAQLGRTLTEEKVAGELAFLAARPLFERPYGLAWLLALHAELAASGDSELRVHGETLGPVAALAAQRFGAYLPKLTHPVRTGVHSQTAFALGLVLDWARAVDERAIAGLVEARARDFFGDDHGYALHLEPSGEDFLSPSLGAADLLARVLAPDELAAWLDRATPALGREGDAPFTPAVVSDSRDGRLAHLDGLNLSRAWMLERIAAALPIDDPRVPSLRALSSAHAERGLTSVSAEHYEVAHWLGTFAAYLATEPLARA